MSVLDNNQVVTKLKSTLSSQGVSVSEQDLANLVKKNRLIKDVERLLAEGHTRTEIDKTVRELISEKNKATQH